MPKELSDGHVPIPTESEMSKSPSHIPLTSSHGPTPHAVPSYENQRSVPMPHGMLKPQAVPDVNLNPYQKKLLEALKAAPNVMKLMGVIFHHYPTAVVKESRQTGPNATARQKQAGRETQKVRLNMEAFIEEEIAKLAGIDVEKLLEEAKAEVAAAKEK